MSENYIDQQTKKQAFFNTLLEKNYKYNWRLLEIILFFYFNYFYWLSLL